MHFKSSFLGNSFISRDNELLNFGKMLTRQNCNNLMIQYLVKSNTIVGKMAMYSQEARSLGRFGQGRAAELILDLRSSKKHTCFHVDRLTKVDGANLVLVNAVFKQANWAFVCKTACKTVRLGGSP